MPPVLRVVGRRMRGKCIPDCADMFCETDGFGPDWRMRSGRCGSTKRHRPLVWRSHRHRERSIRSHSSFLQFWTPWIRQRSANANVRPLRVAAGHCGPSELRSLSTRSMNSGGSPRVLPSCGETYAPIANTSRSRISVRSDRKVSCSVNMYRHDLFSTGGSRDPLQWSFGNA